MWLIPCVASPRRRMDGWIRSDKKQAARGRMAHCKKNGLAVGGGGGGADSAVVAAAAGEMMQKV